MVQSSSSSDKTRENRLRRAASRQGLVLQKSPRRDTRALGFGTYMLLRLTDNAVVAKSLPDGYGLTLDEVEEELTGTPTEPPHEEILRIADQQTERWGEALNKLAEC